MLQSAPVLVIRALSKRYRAGVVGCWADALALTQVNLDIRRGEVVALIGASGSGKTTLLRCGARLLAPDEGFIEHPARADGSENVVKYFADCVQAERATTRGESCDLALIDEVDGVLGDVAAAFAIVRMVSRAKRQGTSLLLAARQMRVVQGLAHRTLILESGRLVVSGAVTQGVARVAEYGIR